MGGYPPVNGQMTAVGNGLRGGFDTKDGLPFLMIGGVGDLDYFGGDNVMADKRGNPLPELRHIRSAPQRSSATTPARLARRLKPMPAINVEAQSSPRSAPAVGSRRPRFPTPRRCRRKPCEIIDHESEVGGYPVQAETRRAFYPLQWNLDDMTPKDPSALDARPKREA